MGYYRMRSWSGDQTAASHKIGNTHFSGTTDLLQYMYLIKRKQSPELQTQDSHGMINYRPSARTSTADYLL